MKGSKRLPSLVQRQMPEDGDMRYAFRKEIKNQFILRGGVVPFAVRVRPGVTFDPPQVIIHLGDLGVQLIPILVARRGLRSNHFGIEFGTPSCFT